MQYLISELSEGYSTVGKKRERKKCHLQKPRGLRKKIGKRKPKRKVPEEEENPCMSNIPLSETEIHG